MTTKIAVSLPDELVEAARESVARGEFASVSAYVAGAIRSYHHDESLADLLADMEQVSGPVDEETKAWARKQLGLDD